MELGTRMKTYEEVSRNYLIRRVPVAIRIDGKAFHTLTKTMDQPFDKNFDWCMKETARALCKEIQGCVIGYTQSDEITLILKDYDKLESQPWFNYNAQKMCSVAASLATSYFIHFALIQAGASNFFKTILSREFLVNFDARCFNIPKEEVSNLLYWRQADAIRNSIQKMGRHYYSDKFIENMGCKKIVELLDKKDIQYQGDLGTFVLKDESWYYSTFDILQNTEEITKRIQ